jgi:arylsulfatase A-like enzyme
VAARLNLIVVCFDTLRRDAVATDLCATPHLDRFAEEAVVYTNAWGEGLPTIPFRRATYTGMRSFPWVHHVGDRGSFPNLLGWHAIPEAQTTLAEYLYQQGYATGLVSDLYHQFKATMNFQRGFVSWDFIRGQEADTYTLSAEALREPSPYGGRRAGPPAYLYQTRQRQRDEDYFVAQVFDRAAEWVEGMRGAGPYLLWVESFTPHEFWDPPQRFADAYCPPDHTRVDHIVPQSLNPRPGREAPDPADVARTRALYQGYVTFADERFGRLLDRLERCGALADSIVVVLSDHGTELWDHGRFGKGADRLHAYNTQINWLIRHPDVRRRHEEPAFVQNQDLVPTLLRLLDVPHPPLDGQDVWPWTRTQPPRDHVVIGWSEYASVRDAEWNLQVHTLRPEGSVRLYDLRRDPGEERDVAADHPEVVARQLRRLEALLGAPLPARYVHRPASGFAATAGGLGTVRRRLAAPGERWEGSNAV